jgi:RNA recognition motif-containing protein
MVKYIKDSSPTSQSFEIEHSLEQNERTIHLSDLDLDTSEYRINDLFRSINLKPSKIVKQPFSSFAYVTFESLPVVKLLLEKSHLLLTDKLVQILPFSQSNNFDPNANLIIKNLETYLSEVHIIEKFKPYGEILSCKLVRDSQGIKR